MNGYTGNIKKAFLILLILSFYGLILLPDSGQAGRSKNDKAVKKKILILEKISRAYKHDWIQLGKSKTEIDKLQLKAQRSIISNVGVVMFKGLANVIQKFFDTPSPSGLLQDLLQEALFDTEAKPKEREEIQIWTKRNFLRRKKLRKIYNLLERVLKTPLERFDDDRAPFPYTENIWKKSDGKSDPYLERITRRLNVIVQITGELSKKLEEERQNLVEERLQVEAHIKQLETGMVLSLHPETGELVTNGSFNNGLASWEAGGGGYSGKPAAQKTIGPVVEEGRARLSVYGGTSSLSQIIPVPHPDLKFNAVFQVIQWSTFDKGSSGGWAAVGISFQDEAGTSLATTMYYLNPHAPSESRKGVRWVRFEPATPVPTRLFRVECDVEAEAGFHQLDISRITALKVSAMIFGTHEDQVMTICDFDEFSLKRINKTGENITIPSNN